MRLNFGQPTLEPESLSARYRAGIEMATWADRQGFTWVTHEEHHGVPNGWSPSPLVTAAAILSRTESIGVSVRALLLPLHDPVRVAEDVAVLDLLSRGRIEIVAGIGHRPEEYAAHGKAWSERGALMDECVDVLLKAWTLEPFEHHGTTVRVTPTSYTQPHPRLLLGGTSKPAMRRAARLGLPVFLAAHLPELAAYYREWCEAHGWPGEVHMPEAGFHHVFVVRDPDRAWAELGTHLLHEATTYAAMKAVTNVSSVHTTAPTVDALRAGGIYRFVTPEEALAEARAAGPDHSFNLHPLCGGMPIDAAWASLELFADEVWSALR